jgi:hypothetical protein
VPRSLKYAVEKAYGMKPAEYGKTLEINHIISLELGGSNHVANCSQEKRDVSPRMQGTSSRTDYTTSSTPSTR